MPSFVHDMRNLFVKSFMARDNNCKAFQWHIYYIRSNNVTLEVFCEYLNHALFQINHSFVLFIYFNNHPLCHCLRLHIFDFTTADEWGCVAAVERLPALHYSVDFIFMSFGFIGFIVEL